MINILEPSHVTDDLLEAFERLIPQLSPSRPPLTQTHLQELIASPASRLLIAQHGHDNSIVGTVTLAMFPIPTGVRAWIDDLVVDTDVRSQGVGEALIRHAIRLATDAGATTLNLTSNPTRQPAHRLYTRLGFTPRQTNVYRLAPSHHKIN